MSPSAPVARLRTVLERVQALHTQRASDGGLDARFAALAQWQSERLARTYADLLADPRFEPAVRFFLEDLYGPRDFTARDRDMARIVPTMERLLPEAVLETVADAMELNALSHELDAAMVEALFPAPVNGTVAIDDDAYTRAFAAVGRAADRQRQVDLILRVGRELDAVVHRPFVGRVVAMTRGPARLAGFGELQAFLERGLAAFRAMGSAEPFMSAIDERERALLDGLLAGDTQALSSISSN